VPKKRKTSGAENGATVGYEAKLWQMADALRGSMDAAEYKHVVLGLIFLKYISDAFEEQHARLHADKKKGADPKTPTNTAPSTFSGCRPKLAQCMRGARSHRDLHGLTFFSPAGEEKGLKPC
jgi:type I restriction-modification system DNA methylase subunit